MIDLDALITNMQKILVGATEICIKTVLEVEKICVFELFLHEFVQSVIARSILKIFSWNFLYDIESNNRATFSKKDFLSSLRRKIIMVIWIFENMQISVKFTVLASVFGRFLPQKAISEFSVSNKSFLI